MKPLALMRFIFWFTHHSEKIGQITTVSTSCFNETASTCQRWPRIRSGEVDSGRILRFFGSGPESKFFEKRTRIGSHCLFPAVAEVRVVFINVIAQVKTLLNFGCMDGCRSVNRSRILKFEKLPDPDSKTWEKERSRGLKMWLRPPLLYLWPIPTDKGSRLLDALRCHLILVMLAEQLLEIWLKKIVLLQFSPANYLLNGVVE